MKSKSKILGTKIPDKVPSKVLLGLMLGKIKRLPIKLPKTKAEKSTNKNKNLFQKIAITSRKHQKTRHRFKVISTYK